MVRTQLWAEYLPYTELYFLEFDGKCVDQQQAEWHTEFRHLKKVYVGDQANRAHLKVITDDHPHNDFDIIIDDGGNTSALLFLQQVRKNAVTQGLHVTMCNGSLKPYCTLEQCSEY